MEIEMFEETLLPLIEHAEIAISLGAVAAILGGFLLAGARFLVRTGVGRAGSYQAFRSELARTLMLSLEILVVADVIRTIALEPSYRSLAALALLVVVRTFMSWTLLLEIDRRWPWQSGKGGSDAP